MNDQIPMSESVIGAWEFIGHSEFGHSALMKDLMDNKRMITGMIVAMMVILGYKLVIDWLWKKNNWTMPQQQAAATQPIEPTTGTASDHRTPSVAWPAPRHRPPRPATQASGIRVVGDCQRRACDHRLDRGERSHLRDGDQHHSPRARRSIGRAQ